MRHVLLVCSNVYVCITQPDIVGSLLPFSSCEERASLKFTTSPGGHAQVLLLS